MKDAYKAIEAVWKIESTRLIAAIARVTHDIGAEELVQDALVTAVDLSPLASGATSKRMAALDAGPDGQF